MSSLEIVRLLARKLFWTWLCLVWFVASTHGQTLGEYWGTAEREAEYYEIVEIPFPEELAIEAGSFEVLPNNRLAIGTRRGEILLADGVFDDYPLPTVQTFASGLDEVLAHFSCNFFVVFRICFWVKKTFVDIESGHCRH